ncbi:BspA family leucine-rich repeat surface protein [Mesonia sp. K7]|uniref:BspA family leucine-rich repeat surface protein n=1 Tax=Mesonia sp. K7 TaxID=2218606 RepID=UPI000DA9D480|nr:BspA family leucine-rich repeat surface protein [Mesonia sp. K7]PZD78057.1 hypothetical protein DNG35_06695 [Mesonia sp. K7]
MRHFYLTIFFIFFTFFTFSQNQPFITTWDATNNTTITIPTHPGSTYNYTIDFGDGTVLNNQTGDAVHTYNVPGSYTVNITGTFPRIYFDYNHPGSNIVSVDQWGDIQWQSMESAFKGCTNLVVNAIDAPDLTQVTDMSYMFFNCGSLNQSINHWDVSNVENMERLFYQATSFNQPLNNWDVSSVTNMNRTFAYLPYFNQPLNNWDVSNVTNMAGMFRESPSFNQPLNNWDVSNVTSMRSMFIGGHSFNQNINNWDVSNVTNMAYMFSDAMSYNQPLNGWDVSSVIDMNSIFDKAISFNQPLNNWDVSNAVSLHYAFDGAVQFNQPLDDWNIISTYLAGFIDDTALSTHNYDNFLSKLVTLGLQQVSLGATGLEYCNVAARDELINNQGWNISGDIASQNCNSIIGEVVYDENNNGCDPSDVGVSGFMVNAHDGVNNIISYSNNGNYEIGAIGTNFTVSLMNTPGYYTVTPVSQQVNFTTTNIQIVDFCVTANQTIEDLNVTLLPTREARPGFEADYRLIVENIGTQAVANASITLDFDDTMQSFVSASVTPISTTANQLTFDITNLQPLTYQTVDITMQTFQPPTVNGDDVLSFTTKVTPDTNDYTPNDNTFLYDQIVVNSYDPNDKQVLQGEEVEIKNADEYLDYLIRFQNTGTASAINVRILDTLHPKLDYSTLKPVNASHNYRIEITNDHEVEFIFDGINLPHESANEPASHGFVAYKIKPKSDVVVGDFITGDANIYFDFNAPIITNMVSTEIIDNIVGTENPIANQIVIYPNPTQSVLNIEAGNTQQIEEIKIYNLHGLEIQSLKGNQEQINLERLSSGVYFIQITTNKGVVTKRILKN